MFLNHATCKRIARAGAFTLVSAAVLVGGAGSNCDASATAAFRSTAVDALGSGVKTIFSGLVDGTVAAVQSTTSSSSSNSNSSGG